MKTIKNVQLIACMLVALYASGINTIPNHSSSSSIEMTYSSKKIKVVIKDSKGKVVRKGKMEETQSVTELFSLDHLPQGDYIIEKNYGHKIEFQTFKVEKEFDLKIDCDAANVGASKVTMGKTYETFKPVLMNRGSLIYVSKMAFQEEKLEIKVYNRENELIHREVFKNTGKIFDFSKIKNEELKLVVTSDGRKYTETLKF